MEGVHLSVGVYAKCIANVSLTTTNAVNKKVLQLHNSERAYLVQHLLYLEAADVGGLTDELRQDRKRLDGPVVGRRASGRAFHFRSCADLTFTFQVFGQVRRRFATEGF